MADFVALCRTFVRVAEAGSFTAAALDRGAAQPTVSRRIARLEEHLGTLLIRRTTRAHTLTDDGRRFLDAARTVLDAVAAAEAAVGRRAAAPSGTVRLACPVVLGRLHVLPRLPLFLARHPGVAVDLLMSDGFADLVEQGIDLAIRVGEIDDPGLIARRIGTTRRVAVAAPGYLAARGEPADPRDLAGHDCVVYSRLATGDVWEFTGPDGPIRVPIRGRIRVDNSEGVREAVLAGLGIGLMPQWHFPGGPEAAGLRVVLRAFTPAALPTHAVYATRRFVPAKVRVLLDFLAEAFAGEATLAG